MEGGREREKGKHMKKKVIDREGDMQERNVTMHLARQVRENKQYQADPTCHA